MVSGRSAPEGKRLDRYTVPMGIGVGGALLCAVSSVQADVPRAFDFNGLYAVGSGNTDPKKQGIPGYNAVPMLWHYDLMNQTTTPVSPTARTQFTYAVQQASGYGAFVVHNDAGIAGGDPRNINDISDTLNWFDVHGYRLDYVMADLEGVNTETNLAHMVDLVRNHPNAALNSARVGNYQYFAGRYHVATSYPHFGDQQVRSEFYLNHELDLSMPSAYPNSWAITHVVSNNENWGNTWWTRMNGGTLTNADESALTPNQRAMIGSAYVAPNVRSALFYVPLEAVSLASRNLPVGHELIPYITDFQQYYSNKVPSYLVDPAQAPTLEDNIASLQHYRLRKANGFYTFSDLADPPNFTRVDYTVYRNAMLNTWTEMDWFFDRPTTVVSSGGTAVTADRVLNLDTTKTTGLEWSGHQRGNRILVAVTNLGEYNARANWSLPTATDITIPLASINSDLPNVSPLIPKGHHAVLQYLSNPTADHFETFSRPLKGPDAGNFQTQARMGTGNSSAIALGLGAGASPSVPSVAWFEAENPGGLGSEMMTYRAKLYHTGAGELHVGFAPVVVSDGQAEDQAIDPGRVGPEFSLNGQSSQFRTGLGLYQSDGFDVASDTWYEIWQLIDPAHDKGSVLVRDLTAGDTQWTQLYFDDLGTAGITESLAWVSLGLDSLATTATFDGWQLTGTAGGQIDDLEMQLYPYVGTTFSLDWQPVPEPGALTMMLGSVTILSRRRGLSRRTNV